MSTLQKYGGTVRKSRTGPPRKTFPKKRPPKARIEGAASAPEPPGRHFSHLGAILRHAARRNCPTGRHFSHLGANLRYAARRNRPTGRHFSHPGAIPRHAARQRSKRAVKKSASQPQTTRHLEKTTRHLEKTTRHLVFPKCLVVFVISKTGFGLRSCYFQAKLGLISPHFSMAGTMLRVTSSSRILHR